MKVDVRDRDALLSVNPLDVLAYLRTSGWEEATSQAGRFAIWVRGEAEVLLPLDRSVRDFPRRVHEILQTLERVEERSELEILHDLSATSADVVRARLEDPDAAGGTVPIDRGVALVEKARDLLLASACAAVAPRAAFGPRRPQIALDYVRRARLGQTEQGSYVITLLSRVPPILEATTANDDVEEPFERRVTTTLARAINLVHAAAERAVGTGNMEAFREGVAGGVSANLCDALVGMAGGVDQNRSLTFDFHWARTRPMRAAIPPQPRVVIGRDSVPVIAEAARIFRETMPQEDYEVFGPVVKLERYGDAEGDVTVVSLGEPTARQVRMHLGPDDYAVAVDAHARSSFIAVVGTLMREGRSWVLNQPRAFRVAEAENPGLF